MGIRWGATVAVALVMSSVVGRAHALDEEKIPLDKVPAPVMKTVKKEFASAEIKAASKDVEDGKTTYEVELKLDGRSVDVSLKEDGTLLAVEKEIGVKDLPKKVASAVTAKYPKAVMKKTEEITSGKVVTYEVVLATAGAKAREVVLDPEGKILKEGDGDED